MNNGVVSANSALETLLKSNMAFITKLNVIMISANKMPRDSFDYDNRFPKESAEWFLKHMISIGVLGTQNFCYCKEYQSEANM